jgi:hypothetical protein
MRENRGRQGDARCDLTAVEVARTHPALGDGKEARRPWHTCLGPPSERLSLPYIYDQII